MEVELEVEEADEPAIIEALEGLREIIAMSVTRPMGKVFGKRVIVVGGGAQVAQVALGAVTEADRHNLRGEKISVDTIPLVGEENIAAAVRAVADLPRARMLVLAGSIMGGEISVAAEELRSVGIPIIALNMVGSITDHVDLVISDPVQAGTMAVMAVADTATLRPRQAARQAVLTMQVVRLADIHVPTTLVAEQAAEAAAAWCSKALMEHNHRAYLWAAARGTDMGLAFDEELLYVAAMLHDIGLVAPSTTRPSRSTRPAATSRGCSRRAPAGRVERRVRLSEIIVRHMWDSVDPAFDAEGHLLEVGTAIDISGPRPGALGARAAGRDPRRAPTAGPRRGVHRLLRRPGPAQARQLGGRGGAQRDRAQDRGQRPRPAGHGRLTDADRDLERQLAQGAPGGGREVAGEGAA